MMMPIIIPCITLSIPVAINKSCPCRFCPHLSFEVLLTANNYDFQMMISIIILQKSIMIIKQKKYRDNKITLALVFIRCTDDHLIIV